MSRGTYDHEALDIVLGIARRHNVSKMTLAHDGVLSVVFAPVYGAPVNASDEAALRSGEDALKKAEEDLLKDKFGGSGVMPRGR